MPRRLPREVLVAVAAHHDGGILISVSLFAAAAAAAVQPVVAARPPVHPRPSRAAAAVRRPIPGRRTRLVRAAAAPPAILIRALLHHPERARLVELPLHHVIHALGLAVLVLRPPLGAVVFVTVTLSAASTLALALLVPAALEQPAASTHLPLVHRRLHRGQPLRRRELLEYQVRDGPEPAHELRVLLRELAPQRRDLPRASTRHLEHLVVARDRRRLRLLQPQRQRHAVALHVALVRLALLRRASQRGVLLSQRVELFPIRAPFEELVRVLQTTGDVLRLREPPLVHDRLLQHRLQTRDDTLLHRDRLFALHHLLRLSLPLHRALGEKRVRLLKLLVTRLEMLRAHGGLVHRLEPVNQLRVASLLRGVPRRDLPDALLRRHDVVDVPHVPHERQPRRRVRVLLLVQQPPQLRVVRLQTLPRALCVLHAPLQRLAPLLRGVEPRHRVLHRRLLVHHVRRHRAQHPRAVAADAEPAAARGEPPRDFLLAARDDGVARPRPRGDVHAASLVAAARVQRDVVQRARAPAASEVRRRDHRAADHAAVVVELEDERGGARLRHHTGGGEKARAVAARPQRRAGERRAL